MVDISIVIVSYNVKEFLKNSIGSIFKASQSFTLELIVVDNHSVDGTTEMLNNSGYRVKLIRNQVNLGFARACNQGIKKASGTYILILNPDTLVREDCLTKCVQYLQQHPQTGALGVKLLDGSGKYLPESKRGFPYPSAAFYKMIGLYKIFPKSRRFNHYYQGHLDMDEIAEIEVLTGAFMFVPKAILEKVGYFDEDFFMYGEDIDLSYRIRNAGYKNIYFPGTSIVHYKGLSTNKKSLRYVRQFYKAMLLFSKKHFSDQGYAMNAILIHLAIYMRAMISVLKRILSPLKYALLDFLVFYLGMQWIKILWSEYYFHNVHYYEGSPIEWNILGTAVISIFAVFIISGYKEYFNLLRFLKAIALAFLIILIIYALLPLELRTSRAHIVLSGFWIILSGILLRKMIRYANRIFFDQHYKYSNVVTIGSNSELERLHGEIGKNNLPLKLVKSIHWVPEEENANRQNIELVKKMIDEGLVDELFICLKDFPASDVFGIMTALGPDVQYKVIGGDSLSIIGSPKDTSPGLQYSLELRYAILDKNVKLSKRILDFSFASILYLFIPLLSLKMKKNLRQLGREFWQVLSGKLSLVSYDKRDCELGDLPRIKEGIFSLISQGSIDSFTQESIHRANIDYAMRYTVWKDIAVVLREVL